MIHYPQELENIFKTFKQNDIYPIIVGGYIRDSFLDIESKDIDIELYNVSTLQRVEELLEEFGDVNSVGKSFGVVKLLYKDLDLDFSLPRLDSKTTKGHKGFKVVVDSSLDFTKASRRRDFTINAMGFDIFKKKLLDPYGGREDLKKKILRAVDLDTFSEDPLRVLRAIVFSSRFHLEIEKQLFKNAKKMIENGCLEELPHERIFQEIKKLLLKSDQPSLGFYLLQKLSGFLFFNEFKSLSDKELDKVFNALDRSVTTTANKNNKQKIIIMLALLTSKFSKKLQIQFLEKLTKQKEIIKNVTTITRIEFDLHRQSNYEIYKLATQVDISLYISYLFALYPKKKELIKTLESKSKNLNVFTKPLKPIIEGKDLIKIGFKPSKKFSDILSDIYEKQMQELFITKEDALPFVKEHYKTETA